MKVIVFSLSLPFLALALLAGWCRESNAPPGDGPIPTHLRQPVALVVKEDGRRVLVANRRSGTISLVDTEGRRVVSETAVGKRIADLVGLGKDRLLAVDEAAGELLVLDCLRNRVCVNGRVRVGDTPVSVRALDATRAVVCCLWSRQLAVVEARPGQEPRLSKSIALPFAPRCVLVLPGESKVVVTDAFGGRLAVVDVERGVVVSVRSLPGHNIRGLVLSGEGKELLLTQQVLAEETPTRADDIRWGNVITNAVRSLALEDLLDPRADLLRRSHLQTLGEFRRGAGDPAGLAVMGAHVIVALAGTGEIALGTARSDEWRRLPMGRRPTAVAATRQRIVVADTFGDTMTVVNGENFEKEAEISLGPVPELTPAERGEQLFFDARLSVEGWMSCHSCHSEGHTNGLRSDTLSDGSYETPKRVPTLLGVGDTAPWAWDGNMTRLEDQVRQSIEKTMRGRKPTQEQVADLTAYLRTLAPPPPHSGAASGDSQRRGETIFRERGCIRCHAPPIYTSSKCYEVGLADETGKKAFNPPSLRGIGHGTAFFHDGRATSLEEVFTRYHHQVPETLPYKDVADLLAFLRTL